MANKVQLQEKLTELGIEFTEEMTNKELQALFNEANKENAPTDEAEEKSESEAEKINREYKEKLAIAKRLADRNIEFDRSGDLQYHLGIKSKKVKKEEEERKEFEKAEKIRQKM